MADDLIEDLEIFKIYQNSNHVVIGAMSEAAQEELVSWIAHHVAVEFFVSIE